MLRCEKKLSSNETQHLFNTLRLRFEKNLHRHPESRWLDVQAKLENNPEKCWSLNEMERTGGEPDVVFFEQETNTFVFYDCAIESPKGRRSLCYDADSLAARKTHQPETSALEMATHMGISLLTEAEYRALQQLGDFDTKTSSWVLTPPPIRTLGGALFADRRYNQVFVYHNGASSYYSSRGFRGLLRV